MGRASPQALMGRGLALLTGDDPAMLQQSREKQVASDEHQLQPTGAETRDSDSDNESGGAGAAVDATATEAAAAVIEGAARIAAGAAQRQNHTPLPARRAPSIRFLAAAAAGHESVGGVLLSLSQGKD